MNHDKPSKLGPVLAGGAFLGVASALPLGGGCLQCACCLFVIAGGFLSVFVYLRGYPDHLPPATYGDGALLGLLSGLLGAVIFSIVKAVGLDEADLARAIEEIRAMELPPEAEQVLEGFQPAEMIGTVVVALLFVSLIAFAVLAMVGGILGIAILQKRPPQAPPQQWSPPQPPGAYTPPAPPPPVQTPPVQTPPEKTEPPEDQEG